MTSHLGIASHGQAKHITNFDNKRYSPFVQDGSFLKQNSRTTPLNERHYVTESWCSAECMLLNGSIHCVDRHQTIQERVNNKAI